MTNTTRIARTEATGQAAETVEGRRRPAASAHWSHRAGLLDERITLRSPAAAGLPSHPLAERWCRRVAGGDMAAFERRLDALGLVPDDVAVLAVTPVAPGDWFDDLADVTVAAERVAGRRLDDDAAWARDHVMPFAALWEPWADVCQEQLAAPGAIDPEVSAAWRELHLQQCAHWGIRAAHAHFLAQPPAAAGVGGYRDWARRLLAAGYEPLFEAYPVLARMLAVATRHAIAAGREFAARLTEDRDAIEHELGVLATDPVTRLRAMGDQHEGGRQVLLVEFASGARLIYKPRSIGPESSMASVVAHVREHGGIDVEIAPRMVARAGHGWSEFVMTRAAGDATELTRYSGRAGATLAIAYATATHDLHLENVIVAGDRPVLVDLECIASAPLRWLDEGRPARMAITESVLSTYLLPLPESDDALAVDICGLTGSDRQLSGAFGRSWRRLGTAEMSVEPELQRSGSSAARPVANGLPQLDIEAFLAGFETAAAAISLHGLGVAPEAIWPNRVILCDTHSYALTLHQAFEPEALVDGLCFSIALDAISRVSFEHDTPEWRRQLVAAERSSLERLDVPMAHGEWNTTDAWVNGAIARAALVHTGREQVTANVANLAPGKVHLQLGIARVALETRLGVQRVATALPAAARGVDHATAATVAATQAVEDTCLRIGEALLATKVTLTDGTDEWLVPSHRGDALVPSMGGQGLYSGAAGCALYLAALARYTGRSDFAAAAARVLTTAPAFTDLTVGDGLAGWAYAATTAGALLADDRVLTAGLTAVRRAATAPELHSDLDLIGGSTGVSLVAASVAQTAGDDGLATAAARLLLVARDEMARRVQMNWVESNRMHRLGVAHGTTGTALAAARVSAVSEDAAVLDWLHELVASENERIDRRGGIPSRVTADARRSPDTTWCWGVAGFAGARAVVAEHLGTTEAAHGLDVARQILAASSTPLHRLCCGAAGWLGVLDDGGRARVAGELVAALGNHVLEDGSSFQSPSLFRGTAGVGYQLLRTLDSTLPDVLTFAPAT